MKKTLEYLRAAKEKLGVETDSALAREIDASRQAVSMYLSGDRIMDDYTAAKIADILGLDPLEVIAAANAEREKNVDRKTYWAKKWEAITATIAAAVFALGVLAGGNFENQPVKRVFSKVWYYLILLR